MKTTMTIGWRDRTAPADSTMTAQEIMRTDVLMRAQRHLAIEWRCGPERAVRALASALDRLALHAGAAGARIQIHAGNQVGAPPTWDVVHGIGVLVRAINADHRIVWEAQIRVSVSGTVSITAMQCHGVYRQAPAWTTRMVSAKRVTDRLFLTPLFAA